ncbi:Putative NAD(P)H nitroreductase [Geobacteraceae bacterium]|nr:Putative NAD(P)H nitroreductase [Geobacteraceae bacterium]
MKYREVLEAAVRAPSGDNCQPWRFVIDGDVIRIFNLPDKDTSLFNHRQRASFVAHGALLENLSIAASAHGYTLDISLFPDSSAPNLVAAVRMNKGSTSADPLSPCIPKRCTNRKRYNGGSLSTAETQTLLAAAERIPGGKVALTGSDREKSEIADVIALNDRLIFENEHLHAFLFDHVRWNDREARERADGLDIKTLELAPPDSFAFPLLKSWPLVSFLKQFGVPRIIAGSARKLALSAAAIGVISVSGKGDKECVCAGRLIERVWLEATRLDLSFQLMTGITLLMRRVLDGETEKLSPQHVEQIRKAYGTVASRFGIEDGSVFIMFRVGRCGPPSVYSMRYPIDKVVEAR